MRIQASPRSRVAVTAVGGIGVKTFVGELNEAMEPRGGRQLGRPGGHRSSGCEVGEERVLLRRKERRERLMGAVAGDRFGVELAEAEEEDVCSRGAVAQQVAENVGVGAGGQSPGKIVRRDDAVEQGAQGGELGRGQRHRGGTL